MSEKRRFKKKPPAKFGRSAAPKAAHRWLVLIDEGPIRQAALDSYHKLEKQIGGARQQIEAFEAGDLPAYGRWEARVLGPFLSELRSVKSAIDEKERILDAIDDEVFFTGCSPVTAYKRVMGRNLAAGEDGDCDAPPGDEDPGESDAFEEGGHGPGMPQDLDPDQFDRLSPGEQREFRATYKEMAELFELMTGERPPPLDELLRAARAKKEGHGHSHNEEPRRAGSRQRHAPPREASAVEKREADRLKELYRSLVRQLHPDANANQTPREKELWHQVQHAYRQRDVELLESVAGRLEIGLNGKAASLPVQILLRMGRELQAALKGLRTQINASRRHPAWDFRKRSSELAKFEAKRCRQIEDELFDVKRQLTAVTIILDELAEKASRPATKPSASKKPARKKKSSPSMDWMQGELF